MTVEKILEDYARIGGLDIDGLIKLIRKNDWKYVVGGKSKAFYQAPGQPLILDVDLINKKNNADCTRITIPIELLKPFHKEMRRAKIKSL